MLETVRFSPLVSAKRQRRSDEGEDGRLTVRDSLGVVVGLGRFRVHADKLEINLILDVGHHDEGGDDTGALAGGHGCRHPAVPDLVGARDERAHSVRRHCQQDRFAAVLDRLSAVHPVGLGGVAEVFGVLLHVGERVQLVVAALADRCWHAGIEREREERVASTETIGTDTTLAILWIDCQWKLFRCTNTVQTHESSKASLRGTAGWDRTWEWSAELTPKMRRGQRAALQERIGEPW